MIRSSRLRITLFSAAAALSGCSGTSEPVTSITDPLLTPSYVYLRCNATGWEPSSSTLLQATSEPGVVQLTFSVNALWMTTGGDTCELHETNAMNGWGTQQVQYVPQGSTPLAVPSAGTFSPGINTFRIDYPSLGTYTFRYTPATGAFSLSGGYNTDPGSYYHLMCNSTSWTPGASTLLSSTGSGLALTYTVSQTYMTTGQGFDDCSIIETNQRDGWGTRQVYYSVSGAAQNQIFAPGGWPMAAQAASSPFHVQYPAVGNYTITLDPVAHTFTIGSAAAVGTTSLVSANTAGLSGNGRSQQEAISPDGRYVVFGSWATDLTTEADLDEYTYDLFIHDRITRTTRRITNGTSAVDGAGMRVGGDSQNPSFSGDGRYVVFQSRAPNIVNDGNQTTEAYIYEIATGATSLLSYTWTGQPCEGASPVVSADARFVVFWSTASNVVPNDTNSVWDLFLRDRVSGATTRVNVSSSGEQANERSFDPRITDDGRFIAFSSHASNLVAGDTNGSQDVFIHERLTGTTELISVTPTGAPGNAGAWGPAVSADGRYVAFMSSATDLVSGDTNGMIDLFVRDRQTGTTRRLAAHKNIATHPASNANPPTISNDGRYISFLSAEPLVAMDTNGTWDAYVIDRETLALTLVSVGRSGETANAWTWTAVMSPDGTTVVFSSAASNLIPIDNNSTIDVFIRKIR